MFVKGNSLDDLKIYFREKLESNFSTTEINTILKSLVCKRLDINSVDYVLLRDVRFSESDLLFFRNAVKRLLNNEPFQYIIGDVEFYGLTIITDKRALIPRPETEELVDWVVSTIEGIEKPRVVDLCSGTGCIALALKRTVADSEVTAVELIDEAITLINDNCEQSGLELEVLKMDVLMDSDYEQLEPGYDCWVSNPPYIPHSQRSEMKGNVLQYEPDSALFVEDAEPLKFYRKIARHARLKLKDGGWLFFEINELYGNQMIPLLEELGFVNIELRKDLQGKDRMIKAQNVISRHES